MLAGVSRYHTHLGAFKVRPKTNELNEICLQCNRSNSFVLTVAPTSDTMHGPSLLKQLLCPHDAVLFSFRHLSDGQNICQYDASRTRWYDLVRITFFRLHFLSPSSQTLCMLLKDFPSLKALRLFTSWANCSAADRAGGTLAMSVMGNRRGQNMTQLTGAGDCT